MAKFQNKYLITDTEYRTSSVRSDGRYLDRVKITLYDSRSMLNICQYHVMQDHWELVSQNTLRHQKTYHHSSAAVRPTSDLGDNKQQPTVVILSHATETCLK